MFKKANVIAAAIAVLSVNAYAQDGNALLSFSGFVFGGGSGADLNVTNSINGTITGEATTNLVETDRIGSVDLESSKTDTTKINVEITRADISVDNTDDLTATATVDLVMGMTTHSDVSVGSKVSFDAVMDAAQTLNVSPEWQVTTPLS
ncbi:hypothetical protein AB4486_27910, partial [Vibrio sp. 10N.222.55.C6]